MMSTSSTATARTPRWSTLLRESLDRSMKENKDSISFALTTCEGESGESSTRFVVHRGFVNERRSNEDSSWSTNPSEDARGEKLVNDNLIVTTDVRYANTDHLNGKNEKCNKLMGSLLSLCSAPKALALEANPTTSLAWWHLPTMTQFRIRSQAYLIKPPSQGTHTPAEILDRLSPGDDFDWEQERIRIFHKMSPELRASFVRPVPGSKLGDKGETEEWPKELPASEEEAKGEKEKAQIKEALDHFALIIMEPYDVDVCDLGAQPNTRVHFFRKKGVGWQGAEWKEEDVVP
ncbi:BZ3500_MvSof-1268-A1-R1_Chr3-2g06262 [Microbotryum saponariae]|uniref:BZ3500_MvSof-1268-A1-R1_Chr3-2g06262 protein n=1 Tax=Microbotryum saponariae TaxID=289078 RepID=A0A2X0MV62_9BASI|nr:BZ3500_MvSof-1268-A1-R1_Chr3-2g06262 [Microbotryum saponariae]SDA04226.1 BZ3501_MvSof-1269-A2-R1_Chr3-2g05953 [Microbotryum saponariae]